MNTFVNTKYNVQCNTCYFFLGDMGWGVFGRWGATKNNNLTIYHITVNTVSTPSELVLIIDKMDIWNPSHLYIKRTDNMYI